MLNEGEKVDAARRRSNETNQASRYVRYFVDIG
jgi:hypothetical protein